ncbi:MAG: LamB/YcsF family protein [Gammaproteobacteria bacterium]
MTNTGVIDLNADLGEGCGDDAAMLQIVTSANIACGAHAGDAQTMRDTIQSALQNKVAIGAHISYPDREHFGRRNVEMPDAQLRAEILDQLRALDMIARECGTRVRYVKPHGALYNRMADDADVADLVIGAIRQFDPNLMLLTLPDCMAMRCAKHAGLRAVAEAFADRSYTATGRLLPRDRPGAVITDSATVSRRGVDIAVNGTVRSADGKNVSVVARSLCVHGDTPDAVKLARALRVALEQAGLQIAAFT